MQLAVVAVRSCWLIDIILTTESSEKSISSRSRYSGASIFTPHHQPPNQLQTITHIISYHYFYMHTLCGFFLKLWEQVTLKKAMTYENYCFVRYSKFLTLNKITQHRYFGNHKAIIPFVCIFYIRKYDNDKHVWVLMLQ